MVRGRGTSGQPVAGDQEGHTVGTKGASKKVTKKEADVEGHKAHRRDASVKKATKKEPEVEGHKSAKREASNKRASKKEADVAGHVHAKAAAKRSNDPENRVH
jgi:hypothetical protein